MKIRLPGFGRFDAHVDPYSEFPDVSMDVVNTLARVTAYDQDNQLFKFIRADSLGNLKADLGFMQHIKWFQGASTAFVSGTPCLLVPAVNYPNPSDIKILHLSFTTNSVGLITFFFASGYQPVFYANGASPVILDLARMPIDVRTGAGLDMIITTTSVAAASIAARVCIHDLAWSGNSRII